MKHNLFLRGCTLLVCLLMFLTVLSGCKSSPGMTETQPPSVTVSEEADDLPQRNMDGFELTFLNYTDAVHGFSFKTICTDDISDEVNSEIFARNVYVESRYNACIYELQTDNLIDLMTKAMMGDLNEKFQIAMVYDRSFNTAYVGGLLSTWDRLTYCDFSKDWWNEEARSVFSMNDKQYGAIGDFSLSMYSKNYCYFYNKDLYSQVEDREDLYELVRNKQWTLDKMIEIGEMYTHDLDGDGLWYDGTDQYGIAGTTKVHYQLILTGSGLKFVDLNEEGKPSFVFGRAESVDKVSNIIGKFLNTNCYYNNLPSQPNGGIVSDDFLSGHVLFFASNIWEMQAYQRANPEFGIGVLPAPLYNENQTQYYSVAVGGEVACVSNTIQEEELENTGILIEAMCSYSHKNILPLYREKVLKTRYSNASEDSEMLQLIFDTTIFDLGTTVWNIEIRTPIMADLFNSLNTNVASYLASLEPKAQGAIQNSLGS